MANTRMSAKNSFQEGLILDISPENMSATSMSSALNATLLTFNGNEMVLQNDMGNGRVETAFLPEGYVPVGTCEFGDIIYIVSYNPLINKSQIGCFPSPERNISTEEIGGLGQTLSWQDFQEGSSSPNGKLKATSVKKILYDNRDMTPGDKYIIYSSDLYTNKQHLSDYGNSSHKHETFPKLVKIHVVSIEESGKIVYLDSTTKWYTNKGGNEYYLSDKGGDAITGKIDLDSYRDLLNSGYSIFSSKVSGKLALLIELEKITGFSCAWEAYVDPEKQSGNEDNTNYSIYMHYNWTTEHNDINPDGVALLTSEWKDGKYYKWKTGDPLILDYDSPLLMTTCPKFSETSRYTEISRHYKPESIGTNYNAYLQTNYNYKSNQYKESYKLNIVKNNKGIPTIGKYFIDCIKVEGNTYYGKDGVITSKEITDSIVNNYFHYPVIKHFADFTIPTRQTLTYKGETVYKEPDITNLIYHYKIAPTMPYGILEEYAQEGYIDFSKLGKRHINLNTWKYYNYENTSTLTWGMEAYTEPNKGIQEVVFEFYDNNGFVAAYHTKDKLSYNGVFTEYLTLNESGTNYKLNNIKAFDTEPTYHKGLEVTKETAVPGFKYQHKDGGNWIDFDELGEGYYYMDDSGTLYSNCLYLVKIIIKYCNRNILDEYIEIDKDEAIIDHRWFWTNNMFNEYYYQEKDFKNIQATLTLDGIINYEGTDKWNIKNVNYISNVKGAVEDGKDSLSANVQYINDKDNIKMSVKGGLIEDYGTFNLFEEKLSDIKCRIHLADEYLNNSPEKPEVIFSDKESIIYEGIYPIQDNKNLDDLLKELSPTLNKLINPDSVLGTGKELWEDYTKYINTFQLNYLGKDLKKDSGKIHYIRYNGDFTKENDNSPKITTSYIDTFLDNANKGFNLSLSGIYFSKYYYQTKKEDRVGRLRPFILEESDLNKYNISISSDGKFFFNKALTMSVRNRSNVNTMITGGIVTFSSPSQLSIESELERMNSKGENNTKGGGDKNIPASLFTSRHNNAIIKDFNFLFPIIIAGYLTNTGYKPWVEGTSKESKISNNRDMSDGKAIGSWSDMDLGGTLAGISTNQEIELGNHYVTGGTKNVLTRFMQYVLGYLTQFYYLDNSCYQVDVPSNYAYLDNNNIEYTRDIVLELESKESWEETSNNHTDLILFKYYKPLSQYISEVLGNDGRGTKALNTDPNVNIKLESCQKNCPIICKFNYIQPSMLYSTSNYIQVNSCFENIPTIINNDFVPQYKVVYGWDFNSNMFKNAKEMQQMNLATYKLENNNIVGTLGLLQHSINNQAKNFTIDDSDCLQFRNIPGSSSTKTYRVFTCDDNGKARGISELKTGIKYF